MTNPEYREKKLLEVDTKILNKTKTATLVWAMMIIAGTLALAEIVYRTITNLRHS